MAGRLMAGLERASGQAGKSRKGKVNKPKRGHPWKKYNPGFFAPSEKVYITGKQRGRYGKRVSVLVDRDGKTASGY